jgi:hypothetical protein
MKTRLKTTDEPINPKLIAKRLSRERRKQDLLLYERLLIATSNAKGIMRKDKAVAQLNRVFKGELTPDAAVEDLRRSNPEINPYYDKNTKP